MCDRHVFKRNEFNFEMDTRGTRGTLKWKRGFGNWYVFTRATIGES